MLSLKGRALRLLSQREHSRAELARKLVRHEQEAGELDKALDDLQARGFIDEARVVESVVNQKAARWGAMRVRQELLAKGVDGGAAAEAVATLQSTELERAKAVWQRRFGGTAPGDAKERARQARFLMARGFAGSVVARVLRGSVDDA